MATVREYCNKLSTSQLEALLREDCAGRGNLSMEAILIICDILVERNPSKTPVREKFLEFCKYYLNDEVVDLKHTDHPEHTP